MCDPSRLPFAAEVPLGGLPPGRYALQVTANDRAAETTAARRLAFQVY